MGTIVAKQVWCLSSGRRIIVHFNDYNQPIMVMGLLDLMCLLLKLDQLRNSKMGDCGGISSDVMGLKFYLLFVERKNDELMRKNDEVISQL